MNPKHGLLASILAVTTLAAAPAIASPETDIAAAAGNGDLYMVKALTDTGANLNVKDEEGYTPLMWAAQHGYANIAAYLVEHGANLNPLDKGGYTPLMWATQEGHYDVAQVLLAHGANVNARGWNGRTALDLATYRGDGRLHELLARYAMGNFRAAAPVAGVRSPVVAQMAPGGTSMSARPVAMGLAPSAGTPGQEPDPISKALALKKLAETAVSAGQDVQSYIKAQTGSIGLSSLSALTDPDLPLGKSMADMFSNVARTQSLVQCRQDWQKVNQAWGGRPNSKFGKYVNDVDAILKSVSL